MKNSFFAALVSILVLISSPARAQDADPQPAVPTSAWLVGPASLAANIGNIAAKIPCVVANQFSNGHVMRFSGGGGALMALAVDVRQRAFEPRHRYDVEFSTPGSFFQVISGAAYDEGTLVFNLQKLPDFYSAMKQADILMVKVQGSVLAYNLIGLDDGFERMETCYNPSVHGPKPLAPPRGPQPTPESQKMPTTDRQAASIQNPLIAQDSARLTPMPGDAAVNEAVAAPPPVEGRVAAQTLMEKAKRASEVAEDLARRSPQKAPPSALPLMAGKDAAGRKQSDIMVMNGKEAPPTEMLWRALKGSNLRQVLDIWTRNTGAQFIWAADQEFVVQKSISLQGSLESAVRTLLAQYDGQNPRPQARIEQQPGAGGKVLVVELGNTQ